jgi:hypothetical protein
MYMTTTTVSREKSTCSVTTMLAAREPVPKTRIMPARSRGYPGAIIAVGPEGVKKGELKPCPACKERAMAIFSNPQEVKGGTGEKLKNSRATATCATRASNRMMRQ